MVQIKTTIAPELGTFYNNKRVTRKFPGKGNNYKHACIKHGSPKHLKQKLTELKREIDLSTIVVEDFNIPLKITHQTIRQSVIFRGYRR